MREPYARRGTLLQIAETPVAVEDFRDERVSGKQLMRVGYLPHHLHQVTPDSKNFQRFRDPDPVPGPFKRLTRRYGMRRGGMLAYGAAAGVLWGGTIAAAFTGVAAALVTVIAVAAATVTLAAVITWRLGTWITGFEAGGATVHRASLGAERQPRATSLWDASAR